MGRRSFLCLVSFLLCLSLSACSWVKSLVGLGPAQPKANLKSIVITGFSPEDVSLNVILSIMNPNKFELGLNKASYNISLFGVRVSKGSYEGQFRVAGESMADLVLPLTIDAKATRQVMEKFMNNPQDIVATVDGIVDFSSPVGSIETSFVREKKISMGN